MSSLVLVASPWPLTDVAQAVGRVVADKLASRSVQFQARPDLGIYDLVVLVAPTLALADPSFLAFVAERGLAGKTLALLTDAPPALGALLFGPWCLAVEQGTGATWWADPLHLGPWSNLALRPQATAGTLAAAETWAAQLAEAHPPRTYPHGPAGRRRFDA
ncbi:MAG: hypothetical protein VKS61_07905 [Candidatus Sericytochromatia bacterium]|nr:hypothetical protein [Candidatus Sericytochromatia bacterium]